MEIDDVLFHSPDGATIERIIMPLPGHTITQSYPVGLTALFLKSNEKASKWLT